MTGPGKPPTSKLGFPLFQKRMAGFSYIKYRVIYVVKLFLGANSKNLEFHQCIDGNI